MIGWCADKDVSLPPLDALSDTGLIIDGVACGFLYLTNSSVGILEGYFANPGIDKNDRSKALNWITIHLIDLAKTKGVKVIKCDSKIDAVIDRALSFGFRDVGKYTVLMKEL